MGYEIRYYNSSVEQVVLALPVGLRARYFSLADRMEIFGAHLGEPHTKALGDGLFELRLKSPEGHCAGFLLYVDWTANRYAAWFCQKVAKNTGWRTEAGQVTHE